MVLTAKPSKLTVSLSHLDSSLSTLQQANSHLVASKEQTRQSLTNAKAILEEAGIGLGNVMKTTVFLSDMNDFAAMNEVYAEFFNEPFPARSAIAVKTLPKNALVEVECIAAK